MIDYRIQPLSPTAHLFQVEVTIQNPDPGGQRVSLPSWIPGSYMIRDFSRNIVTLSAQSDGAELTPEKLDKQTWRFPVCTNPITVRYQVYAWDLSVRSAHLDITHGFFNGTSVFLKVEGQEDQACLVDIRPPAGDGYADWQLATTMTPCGAEPWSFGLYGAANYEELIDHPVEMGTFSRATFDVAGKPHDVVITGRHYADMSRICRDLEKICAEHVALFGELPEMDRYLFLVMVVDEGYGGLEHRSSTALVCKRDDLPQKHQSAVSEGYRQFLGLCSHEYFHLWNVKRIRPENFIGVDLKAETYTRLLWAFEGITSYYDDLALVRSGCINETSYLELLAKTITRTSRGTGRLKQSVSDSSFDAWTKFYKQDENAPNSIVSYYTKGAVIALALDLMIRQKTAGDQSLDDIMRLLWQQYGRRNIGIGESELERTIETFTGLNLKAFFDYALRGCGDIDLESPLESVGVGFRLRPARGVLDQGGVRGEEAEPEGVRLVLGIATRNDGDKLVIGNVFDDGAAQIAGLSAGDVLLAVDGLRVSEANLENLVGGAKNGAPIQVHVFRRDELMVFEVTPLPAKADTCELWLQPDVEASIVTCRGHWLSTNQVTA